VSRWLAGLSWGLVALACATLGLAPFLPMPHVLEKLGMLARGSLARPIDWFDLLLHGSPWMVLIGKAVVTIRRRSEE